MTAIDLLELEPQQLLALRRLSREHLLPFVQYTTPGYMPGWVHKDICLRLERFERQVMAKESPRLILSMPPRHGKSQIATICFPAWFLGRHPELEFIGCSYSSTLAGAFSKKIRDLMRSEDFMHVFPDAEMDPTAQSVENWYTIYGGSYLAAGVGSGITGRGAHILGIDDPVKNREDAESETFLQSLYDRYTSTAYTRLSPGGGVLVIQTRWSDRDLAGRLEEASKKGTGDEFEVVTYPAIATHNEDFRRKGEALHPERYDLRALSRIRKAIGPRDWAALYQQSPAGDVGTYFKPKYFVHSDVTPMLNLMSVYQVWDLALGLKERNDYSVCLTVGIDVEGRIWVLDLWRDRKDSLDLTNEIIKQYQMWKPSLIMIEESHMAMSIGPILTKTCIEQNVKGLVTMPVKPGRRDKVARARAIQGRFQDHRVVFPANKELHPWLDEMENELLAFPDGLHDDIVDTFAYLGLFLVELAEGRNFDNMTGRRKQKSWRDKLSQYVGGGRGKKNPMTA